MSDSYQAEAAAYAAQAELMKKAAECRDLFVQARLAVPARLGRFLADGQVPAEDSRHDVGEQEGAAPAILLRRAHHSGPRSLEAPKPPEAPPENVARGWVWIPIADLTATTLVRGLLAVHPDSPAKMLIRYAQDLGVKVTYGTLMNIGARLDAAGEIERRNGRWTLLKAEVAPRLGGVLAWGPETIFDSHELAAHRRIGVVHVLSELGELQIVRIVEELGNAPWNKAPVEKTLVRQDLLALQKLGYVKRGRTGWRAMG